MIIVDDKIYLHVGKHELKMTVCNINKKGYLTKF